MGRGGLFLILFVETALVFHTTSIGQRGRHRYGVNTHGGTQECQGVLGERDGMKQDRQTCYFTLQGVRVIFQDHVAETVPSHPLAQDTEHRIRWFGAFASPEWEKAYRVHELPEGVKLCRIFVGLVIAAFLVSLFNDYRFFGNTAMFGWMLAMRGVVVVGAVVAVAMIRYGMPTRKFDGIIITWTMSTKICLLIILATRPNTFIAPAIICVMSILLTYWIVPIPFIWRALTSGFVTAGMFIIGWWINPWPDQATAISVSLALVMTNVIGGEMCREQQIGRRRQFLALRRQEELSANLEKALSEIKTLEGILPICMHCKRIADEHGKWEPVEVYIHEHSDAQFSHSLCPDCKKDHYPEIDWEEARRDRERRAERNSKGL